MGHCPDTIKRLIDRFAQQSDQIRSPDYNETLIRIDYINPLMSELGWDINNHQGFAERYREVVHEDRVRVAGQTKAPDYSFRIGGQRKFFLEAKKPAVDIRNNWEPAYQLRRYAWSAKLACSLLTDFEEFAVYDTRIQPRQLEKASVARREYIRYTDYSDRWDFLSGTFSKDGVLSGDFDRYCESVKGRGAQLFDDAFLGEIEEWRMSIASSLARQNESLDEAAMNFAVQRIIDRIIFLRIAEDRGTETIGQLQALLNGDSIYPRLCKLFRDADARYNSGLFHFAKEKDRNEAPDTLTPGLEVDDRTLKGIIKALYYPQSPYEFTMVSADILGSIYERFLGKVITLTAGHKAKVEEKLEVRKAGGVYYTPTYIVDYIVKNTVGALLEGKSPHEAAGIKVLDPACGSGSFLVGAYQFLLDWYHTQYTAADPAALAAGKKPVLRPGLAGGWALTIAERKCILLDHIHGVDLDGQAVEVTKLNLLLKCLEGETSETLGFQQRLFRERALPDLGKNILCGNSLIGTDIIGTEAWNGMSEEERRRVNPFDYELAFPQVFKQGGFDAVVGNPPYIRIQTLADSAPFEVAHYQEVYSSAQAGNYDLYVVFLERGLRLLRSAGLMGFIVPNKYLNSKYGASIRGRLAAGKHLQHLVHFGDQQVFKGATTYTCLTFLGREPSARFRFTRVLDLDDWNRRFDAPAIEVDATELGASEWNITGDETRRLLGKLRRCTVVLRDIAHIFVGLQTSADGVFVVPQDADVEATITKPFLLTGDLTAYCPVPGSARLIFPYEIQGPRAKLREPGWIREHAPTTWKHLVSYRGKLAARDGGKFDTEYWYAFGRSQNLTEMERPKLIIQVTSIDPIVMLDREGVYLTGGGAGPFHCIRPVDEGKWSLEALLGILNSNVFGWVVRSQSTPLRGGYFKYSKQYIETAPIPDLSSNRSDAGRLALLVDSMLSLQKRLVGDQVPQRREQIKREIQATDRQINQLVYQLYELSDDEIAVIGAAAPQSRPPDLAGRNAVLEVAGVP